MSKNKLNHNSISLASKQQQYAHRILSTKNSVLSSLSPNDRKHNLVNSRTCTTMSRNNIENIEQSPILTEVINDVGTPSMNLNLNSLSSSVRYDRPIQKRAISAEKCTNNMYNNIEYTQNSLQKDNHLNELSLQYYAENSKEHLSHIDTQLSKSCNNNHQDSVTHNISGSISRLTSQRKKVAVPVDEYNNKTTGIKSRNYIEMIAKLREIIHKLQLKDAIHRQEISKLRKQNETTLLEVQILEEKIIKLEKARQIDNEYLMKLDNQLLQDKRQKSAKKSPNPQERYDHIVERNSTVTKNNYEKKIDELNNTIQSLKEKIKLLTSEKSKFEEVIKNLLFEKELEKRSFSNFNNNSNNSNANNVENNSSILKDCQSPQSPKFVDYQPTSNIIKDDKVQAIKINQMEFNNSFEKNFKNDQKNICGHLKGEKRSHELNYSSQTSVYHPSINPIESSNKDIIFWRRQSFEKVNPINDNGNNSLCHELNNSLGKNNAINGSNAKQQKGTMSFSNDFWNENHEFQVSPSIIDIHNPTMNESSCNLDSVSKEKTILDEIKIASPNNNLNISSSSINPTSTTSRTKNFLNESFESIKNPSQPIKGLTNSSIGINQSFIRGSQNLADLFNKIQPNLTNL